MEIKSAIKRLFDILASLLGMIVISPFFLLIALVLKLSSPGPVFFGQERLGKGGKPFKIWKFRTMIEGAEKIGLGAKKDDFRITRLGRFLREWTLDEWPQLFNVIKGEMSLVGPRPLPKYPNQNDSYGGMWQKRLSAKPGLVCLVDLKGRGLLSWEKRLEYDAWYVDNWSLWLDIKILILGFFAVLSRRGVYGEGTVNLPPKDL